MENKEEKISSFDLLNDNQKMFVLNYIKHRVATRAYLDAYSTEENPLNYDNAAIMASKLLRNIKVSEAINEKLSEIWDKKEQEAGKIFDELIALGFSDFKNLMDNKDGNLTLKNFEEIDTRCIKKIKVREEKRTDKNTDEVQTESYITEIELHDKKGSLAELADILSLKKKQVELIATINQNDEAVQAVLEKHGISSNKD